MKLTRRRVIVLAGVLLTLPVVGFVASCYLSPSVSDAERFVKGATFEEMRAVLGEPAIGASNQFAEGTEAVVVWYHCYDGYVSACFDGHHRMTGSTIVRENPLVKLWRSFKGFVCRPLYSRD